MSKQINFTPANVPVYNEAPEWFLKITDAEKAFQEDLHNNGFKKVGSIFGLPLPKSDDSFEKLHQYLQKLNEDDRRKAVNYRLTNGDHATSILYRAVLNGKYDLCKYLLENGAYVNLGDCREDLGSPLHRAVYENNLEIVKLLVENKADLFERARIINNTRMTPYEVAKEMSGCGDIANYLKDAMKARDKEMNNRLTFAPTAQKALVFGQNILRRIGVAFLFDMALAAFAPKAGNLFASKYVRKAAAYFFSSFVNYFLELASFNLPKPLNLLLMGARDSNKDNATLMEYIKKEQVLNFSGGARILNHRFKFNFTDFILGTRALKEYKKIGK
ncbi:MAG: ankyrin repeat domain-containing protein [Alphaproteobacteria bacterium]|nr:ankyrin repeat domain-containing protein [Alphaproteobacteria bacterium]